MNAQHPGKLRVDGNPNAGDEGEDGGVSDACWIPVYLKAQSGILKVTKWSSSGLCACAHVSTRAYPCAHTLHYTHTQMGCVSEWMLPEASTQMSKMLQTA